MEAAQLRTLNENDHAVVSTGGGTPCHHHNMQWMNQHGYTIYLKMPAKALYHRLAQAKEQRPLLTQQEDPLTFITQHLKAREPFYQKARLVVDAHTLTLDDLEEKLKPLLSYPLF
ncbi:MAG: hypothetical protein CSA95_02870 [Bacteroidetes bacterium]|nr:MAG: hypothetical protein CSA95_02870 [Bacteroidota bacterium]